MSRCHIFPALWSLCFECFTAKKKTFKSCWRLSLCYVICQDRNAAMLFSAWSKILDKAAVLVAVTMSLKMLCWLVWHLALTLSSYFRLQQQGLISLMEKGFFEAVSSSASPKLTDNGLFNLGTLQFPGRVPYAVCLSAFLRHLPQKPKLSFQVPIQVSQSFKKESFKKAWAFVHVLAGCPSQMSLPAPLAWGGHQQFATVRV